MDCQCYQHAQNRNFENHHSKKHECPIHSYEPKTFLDFLGPMMKNKETTQFINLLLILFLKNLEESTQNPMKEHNYHNMKRCHCEHGYSNRRKNDHHKSYKETFNDMDSTSSSSEHRVHKMTCPCNTGCNCKQYNHHDRNRNRDRDEDMRSNYESSSEGEFYQNESTSSSSEQFEHKIKCHCNTGCNCKQYNDHGRDHERVEERHPRFESSSEERFHPMESTSSSSEHRDPRMKCHACNCHSNSNKNMHQQKHTNSTLIPAEMLLSELLVLMKPNHKDESSSWSNHYSHQPQCSCSCYQDSIKVEKNQDSRKKYDESSSHQQNRKRKTRYFKDSTLKSSKKTTTFKRSRRYN